MAETENKPSVWDNLQASLKRGYDDDFWKRHYGDNIKDTWKKELGNLPFARYFQNSDGKLIYVNNRAYHSIAVAIAKWKAAEAIQKELSELLDFRKRQQQKSQKERQEKWENAHRTLSTELISRGAKVHTEYGKVPAKNGSNEYISAIDKYGNTVNGALIMWYEGDDDLTEIVETHESSFTKEKLNNGNTKIESKASVSTLKITTNKVFVIDLAPQIRIQSSKNVILTKVQGRDYTRKELISGGDLCFSVSGEIMSNYADVYPSRDVQKFIKIMQHSGVISVNNLMFGQFNVKNIIIQSYHLETPKYQNIQPYSFTCVAVEPDDIQIVNDTINTLNYNLQVSQTLKEEKWYNLILNGVLNGVENAANSLLTSSLDALTYNI